MTHLKSSKCTKSTEATRIYSTAATTDSVLPININLIQTRILKIKYSQPNRISFYFPKIVPFVSCRRLVSVVGVSTQQTTMTIYRSNRGLISPINRSSTFIKFVNPITFHNIFIRLIIPTQTISYNTQHIKFYVVSSRVQVSFINKFSKSIEFVNSIHFTKVFINLLSSNSYHDLRRRRI